MLPCIAAVAIATFVGTKTLRSNASGCDELLLANTEALSMAESPKPVDDKVTVRGGKWLKCYSISHYTNPCPYAGPHDYNDCYSDCRQKFTSYNYSHQLYHKKTISVSEYEKGGYTLLDSNDITCTGYKAASKPEDVCTGHTHSKIY